MLFAVLPASELAKRSLAAWCWQLSARPASVLCLQTGFAWRCSANNKTGTTKLAATRGRKLGLLHGHVIRSFCAGGAPGGRPSRGVGLSSLWQARAESESSRNSAAMHACATLWEAAAGGCVLIDSC